MKVLLVLVSTPELKPDQGTRLPIMAPPLTLPLLAELARRAGFEVELLDSRFFLEPAGHRWVLDEAALEAKVLDSQADIAAISFMSSSAEDGFRVAEFCSGAGMTVIGGGIHASVAPEEYRASGAFDYLVQGEAEASFPELLAELARGARPARSGEVEILPARGGSLADMPIVRDLSPYEVVYERGSYRVMYVETNRGCFKRCAFCEVAQGSKGFRPLRKVPLEKVLATMTACIDAYGINYVLVADSVATIYKPHFLQFLDAVQENFSGLELQFNSTVDRWDEELARASADTRCSVWFGFESGSQRVLDEVIQKGTTVEQAYTAARLCVDHGIPHAFNILIGLPGETQADLDATRRVLEGCPRAYPNPNIFSPLPGTKLYRECLERGLLRNPSDYTIWDVDRIRRTGTGPVIGVDYQLIASVYDEFSRMGRDPSREFRRARDGHADTP